MTPPTQPASSRLSAFIRRPLGITLATITGLLALCCVVGIVGAVLSGPKPSPTPGPATGASTTSEIATSPASATAPRTPPPTTTEARPTGGTSVYPVVHPGAFCSPAGALGVTAEGTLMVCKTTATDSRLRWRAA